METYFEIWAKVYAVVALRYFFFASIVFFPCYFWLKDKISWRKIQDRFPNVSDYRREIGYSMLTFVIFGLSGLFLYATREVNLMYEHLNDYPIWWFVISIPLALIIHDAYFYWTHRIMHHPRLFKTMHLVHHKSTNPSPWASFAFHPTEAVIESSIAPLLAFILPMHPIAMVIFLLIMTAENVMGHLGYEFFPKWLTRSKIGYWLNTSTNHNMHHKYFHGNYGLYFRWWDIWMGTTHPKYYETLEELQDRLPQTGHVKLSKQELASG